MAAEAKVTIGFDLSGLGQAENWAEKFTVTGTPARKVHGYWVQTTTDVAEALDMGDVATVQLIIIRAVSKALYVDTSYVSSFNAEVEVPEGEYHHFKPTGTVYLRNKTTSEVATVEYWIIGTA